MSYNRSILITLLLVAAAIVFAQCAAVAQTTNPPVVLTLSNQYIEFNLGVSGAVTIDGSAVTVAGRFGVVSRLGDPEVPDDDARYLIPFATIPLGGHGYWRVRVANDNMLIGGEVGTWSKVPQLYDPPAPGQMNGKTGPYIEGEWLTNANEAIGVQPIRCRIHISLVRDQVRFETTLINEGTATQNVGLGLYFNQHVDDTGTGGYPFIPGVGLARTVGFTDAFYGRVLSNSLVPSHFEVFDSVENPKTVVRNTLRGGDCVVPDHVGIGEWESMSLLDVWLPGGYVPDPLTPVSDVASLLVWNPKAVYPRATRKIVTYYGIGAASSAWTHRVGSRVVQDSAMLAVQGPRALKYDSTDPTQGTLQPSQFQIKAYVYNLNTDPGPYTLGNVSAYLYLPRGLELVSTSTAQQEIGEVPINSEAAPVTWDVQATGEYCGELEYFVSVRDSETGWQQVVSRKIMVPSTKNTLLRSGYQLMSVPFTANNLALDHLFGLTSGSFFATGYDAAAQRYLPLTQIEAGKAFWMTVSGIRAGSTMPIALADDAKILGEVGGRQVNEIHVRLEPGWNMVGNPYVYPVCLGQLLVYHDPDGTVTFDQAVTNNWISRTIFYWNSDKSAYETLKGSDSYLLPWKGYWVRTRIPVTLVFRPAIFPACGVTALPGGY